MYTPMWKDAPLAPAVIVMRKGKPDGWRVIRCPYCAGSHNHGIGEYGDPRQWLGGRVSHCNPRRIEEDTAGLAEYRLIGIEGNPTRRELDEHFPIYWHRGLPSRPQARMPLSTPDIRDAVWKKSNGFCWYCGDEISPFSTFSIDHVLPLKLGGENRVDNLVPCCPLCNSRKGAMHMEVFRTRVFSGGPFWFEMEGLNR